MSANGNGHHWSKFCWRDWQNDEALQMCSLAAQGLWMRLLCLAHASNPVGHVLLNGKRPTSDQIAILTRSTRDHIEMLLRELEDARVFSKTKGGVMFSRRMVRDAQASDIGRENAEKRWERQRHPNGDPNGGATDDPNAKSQSQSQRKNPPVTPPSNGGVVRGATRASRDAERKPFRSGALELIRREAEERGSAVPWLDLEALGHVH